MPIDATPITGAGCVSQLPQYPGQPTPSQIAVSCNNRNVFTTQPGTEAVSGAPILSRLRSVRLPANQPATLKHILHTDQGQPVNVSDCVCSEDSLSGSDAGSSVAECAYAVRFTMQEAMQFEAACPVIDVAATVVNGSAGEVQVELLPGQLSAPGVYTGQFSLVRLTETEDEEDVTILSNLFYVIVGRNLTRLDGNASAQGPPTIPEVRLFLRDTSPAESFLLEGVKFSDEEIAYAIQLPVMYWNEVPPPLNPVYTTANFPYRYHWLIAITGYLFLTASEQQRANNLQYNAGGTAVNDQDKELSYEAAAERRLQEWRTFVRHKKTSLNLALGWGSLGSGYW